eukprot:TRINITY_DN15399_c0_g1_i1.p1 TRINITY_DN15399_c0_g1~~TRINITY_DN15399_c0_g1_i1.p1  ORF type:complete len:283 (+),score=58.47 TRINITY_DN15399_c0_g1_i1:45-851(+)
MARFALVACTFVCALPVAQSAEERIEDSRLEYVRCGSSTGDFLVEVHHEWAPNGAARYLELVREGIFDAAPLFRCIKGFLVQFGIPAVPDVKWKKFTDQTIPDDPSLGIELKKGYMSFAGYGPNSRTNQVFITYGYPNHLGKAAWETPFGRVVEGMENVDAWYGEYGDKVDQLRVMREGAAYVQLEHPNLSFMQQCEVVPAPAAQVTMPPPTTQSVTRRPHGAREGAEVTQRPHGAQLGWEGYEAYFALVPLVALLLLYLMRSKKKTL